MERLKKMLAKHESLIIYMAYSLISTVVDAAIVYIMIHFFQMDVVVSNTTGVVSGFILHYLLASKKVFHVDYGFKGLLVYFVTFLIGLVLADGIIALGYFLLSDTVGPLWTFLLSKGFSVALPFFVMYYLRIWLYGLLKKREEN